MDMLRQPRTSGIPLIDTHVRTIGIQCLRHQRHRGLHQSPEGRSLLRVVLEQRWSWFPEGDQQMSIGIRISVEENHATVIPVNDMILDIQLG